MILLSHPSSILQGDRISKSVGYIKYKDALVLNYTKKKDKQTWDITAKLDLRSNFFIRLIFAFNDSSIATLFILNSLSIKISSKIWWNPWISYICDLYNLYSFSCSVWSNLRAIAPEVFNDSLCLNIGLICKWPNWEIRF